MPADDDPSMRLGYAPPSSVRRRMARRLWLPLVLLCVGVSTFWWGPPLWYRVRLQHAEQRCATYVVPPDTIVYSEVSGESQRLLKGPGGYQAPRGGSPDAAFRLPEPWTDFYGLLSPPGFQSMGTVFLHERRTAEGRRVIVAVEFLGQQMDESGPTGFMSAQFQVRVFKRGGLFELPKEIHSDLYGFTLYNFDAPGGSGSLRLLAGQPDPADASHFSFVWQVPGNPGVEGVIDGWVQSDGVKLQRRESDAKRPAARSTATPALPASPG